MIPARRNADQLLPLAGLARELGLELRLIEFMDVGNRNGWQPGPGAAGGGDGGPDRRRLAPGAGGAGAHGTASRWRYRDRGGAEGGGEGGGAHLAVVASITAPFCGDCNRLRITADGVAYSCLFAGSGTDLRPWLRPRPDPAGLREALETRGGPAATAGARSARKPPTSDRRRRRWPTWGAEGIALDPRPDGRPGPGSAGPPERSSPSGGWRPGRCPRRRGSTHGTDAGADRRHR